VQPLALAPRTRGAGGEQPDGPGQARHSDLPDLVLHFLAVCVEHPGRVRRQSDQPLVRVQFLPLTCENQVGRFLAFSTSSSFAVLSAASLANLSCLNRAALADAKRACSV
jgi:hypothetical protein